MIYKYIVDNYINGEPIFLSELPCSSKTYLRQEMKALTDKGKLMRLCNGVYYLPYTTILGTPGGISIELYIKKKYIENKDGVFGYITGLQLANKYGFTSQNPACYEICSNKATTNQRNKVFDGNKMIIYKPLVKITKENKDTLQFLDLMSTINKYKEISGKEYKTKIERLQKSKNINYELMKTILPLYPARIYRNLYEGGLFYELVQG